MTLSALLVCADEAAAHVLLHVLEELSIRVESCPDFARAAFRANQERFDVIVVDGESSAEYTIYFKMFRKCTDSGSGDRSERTSLSR